MGRHTISAKFRRPNFLALYTILDDGSFDGAVELTSIHLAFYQMNPWLTATSRILNLWHPKFELISIFFSFALRILEFLFWKIVRTESCCRNFLFSAVLVESMVVTQQCILLSLSTN